MPFGLFGVRESINKRVDSNADAHKNTIGAGEQSSDPLVWSIQTTPQTLPVLSTRRDFAIAPCRHNSLPVLAAASRESKGGAYLLIIGRAFGHLFTMDAWIIFSDSVG
jgi:hypothetical protein